MSNIFGLLFYILFLSKFLHVLHCSICFGQVICLQLQERALCSIGFSPLMSSLSDRNMRLGDVLLPPGVKQRCSYLRVQGLFTLRKVLFKRLSVDLDLHFGWDSQLNTSEMFWIDISRCMIRIRSIWISVYLPWRTAHAFEPLPFICSIVSIAVRFLILSIAEL